MGMMEKKMETAIMGYIRYRIRGIAARQGKPYHCNWAQDAYLDVQGNYSELKTDCM